MHFRVNFGITIRYLLLLFSGHSCLLSEQSLLDHMQGKLEGMDHLYLQLSNSPNEE